MYQDPNYLYQPQASDQDQPEECESLNLSPIVNIIAVIITILLFMVLLESYRCGCRKWKHNKQYINGFWKADSRWCDEAGVSNVMATMNYNPDENYGVMYLVIQNEDGDLVDNNSYPFKLNVPVTELLGKNEPTVECRLTFDNEVTPVGGKIPVSCQLRMNILDGVIAIHDGEMVFLELYKDTMTSSVVETYLPERPRTDPQHDLPHLDPSGLGEINGVKRKFKSNSTLDETSRNNEDQPSDRPRRPFPRVEPPNIHDSERIGSKQYLSEQYLPERPRTDPQKDTPNRNPSGLGEINGHPRSFESNSRFGENEDGESILDKLDPNEGEAI